LQFQILRRLNSCCRLCIHQPVLSTLAVFLQLCCSCRVVPFAVWFCCVVLSFLCIPSGVMVESYLAFSSVCIGVIPVSTQRASCEVVRYAFTIFMFISLWILLSFKALCLYSRQSIRTGASYDKMGNIVPVYMIQRT
jgi:hypothetical protein